MRSRWSHAPRLAPREAGRRVGWLEIFLDLVMVGALLQAAQGLGAHSDLNGFVSFLGVGALLWGLWLSAAFFSTLIALDDLWSRIVTFLFIFALGGVAVAAPEALQPSGRAGFGLACAAACALQALLFGRVWRSAPEAQALGGTWGLGLLAAGTLCALGGGLPPPWGPLPQGAAVLLLLGLPLSPAMRAYGASVGLDQRLLGERFGLATLLLLGVMTIRLLAQLAADGGGLAVYLEALGALLLASCLWWIYFDDVAGARLREQRAAPTVWLYGHLPLMLGLGALGASLGSSQGWTRRRSPRCTHAGS